MTTQLEPPPILQTIGKKHSLANLITCSFPFLVQANTTKSFMILELFKMSYHDMLQQLHGNSMAGAFYTKLTCSHKTEKLAC